MARNDNVSIPAGVWTQLTNADVTEIRVQNRSGYTVELMATADTTQPTNSEGAIVMPPNGLLAADITLAQLWPGVSGAVRVWAKCTQAADLGVSHA